MKTPTLLLAPILALTLGHATAKADSPTTTFGANAIAGGGWTNLFDVSVATPGGIQFTAFTVNIAQSGGPLTLNIYVRPTTYVGSEATLAGWTLVASGTTTPSNPNGPLEFDVPDFTLPAGTYGFALVNTNYQIGFTVPPPTIPTRRSPSTTARWSTARFPAASFPAAPPGTAPSPTTSCRSPRP